MNYKIISVQYMCHGHDSLLTPEVSAHASKIGGDGQEAFACFMHQIDTEGEYLEVALEDSEVRM